MSAVPEHFAMAPTREAVVLVLGDVGRSPRMQYHALSLAQMSDVHVTLVGFAGERCCPPVETSSNITQLRLRPPEKKPVWLPFVLFGPFKVVLWIMQLLWALFWGVPRPTWVLVQNPPSIPTLLVAWIVCRLRGASLIVDWHNFVRCGPWCLCGVESDGACLPGIYDFRA